MEVRGNKYVDFESVLYNVCESILDFFEVGSYNFQSKFTIVAKLWRMSRKPYVYLNRYETKIRVFSAHKENVR